MRKGKGYVQIRSGLFSRGMLFNARMAELLRFRGRFTYGGFNYDVDSDYETFSYTPPVQYFTYEGSVQVGPATCNWALRIDFPLNQPFQSILFILQDSFGSHYILSATMPQPGSGVYGFGQYLGPLENVVVAVDGLFDPQSGPTGLFGFNPKMYP